MSITHLCTFHLRRYLVAGLALLVPLLLVGCGSDSYDEPKMASSNVGSQAVSGNGSVAGAETSVLIEPATLKTWMDQGLVNYDGSFDQRVVVIDFGADPTAEPLPMHIEGACLVGKSALTGTRMDGLAPHTPLVATGEQMDAVMQSLGIDGDTVIVFTSDSNYNLTRAYWTFRYWGFPRNQLKVINGGNARFAAAYPDLMTQDPVAEIEHSTFSVRDLGGVKTDLRASMGEMIEIIKGLDSPDSNDVVIDARGDGYYFGNKNTSALIADGKVVVDGHPAGGQYLANSEVRTADNTYKSKDEIQALFEARGWEPGKKVTVYCTSAYSATPLFLALDAILDVPVQLHDGSWSQTGLYSDYVRMGGQLPVGSQWAIDKYLANADYNLGELDPLTIEPLLNPLADQPDPFDGSGGVNPAANQVEEADLAAVGGFSPVTFSGPVADAPAEVLINPETLQGWIDAGLLDIAPGSGSKRVVLLDAATASSVDEDGNYIPGSYAKGHIPGAQLWDISPATGHVQHRLEGPAAAVNMVVDAERMNTLIQKHGIDENTTIVITSSLTATYFPSRAYFLFRYYGWPKDQIKVLDGYNGAWIPSEVVTGEPVAVTPSDLSVQAIGNLQPDLRVSLPELMDAVRDGRGTPVDFRGDKTATGSTPGVFGDGGDYVVFEGRPVGGESFVWKNFNVDYDKGDFRFKSAADIEAALNAAGIFNTDGPIYSYCRTGYIASTGFFVLDGLLGWDVMTYDGSWSQWGKLSDDPNVGGELPAGSPWVLDNSTYMGSLVYNVDNTVKVAPLNPDENLLGVAPSDPAVNQVENEDSKYQQEASSTDGGGSLPSPNQPALGGC